MNNSSTHDEYEAIASRDQSITLASGKQVTIRPMTIATVAKMARALNDQALMIGLREAFEAADAMAFVPFCLANAEHLIAAVAIGADIPLEEVEAMQLDDFVALTIAVYGVNQDFFVRRLAPMITKAATQLATGGPQSKAQTNGQAPGLVQSLSSSAPAIPSTP